MVADLPNIWGIFSFFPSNKTAKIWHIVLAKGINKKTRKMIYYSEISYKLRDVIILYIILKGKWKLVDVAFSSIINASHTKY